MSEMNLGAVCLESQKFRYGEIKSHGDRTFAQLSDHDIVWRHNHSTNSIAVVVQHLHGNMVSRWTDFLTSDGEKETRQRDAEFEAPDSMTKDRLLELWEEGWTVVNGALESLTPDDLLKTVTIRGQELTVLDAINRQQVHYAYHMGQVVHIAKERLGDDWQTLSIARGQSREYTPTKRD